MSENPLAKGALAQKCLGNTELEQINSEQQSINCGIPQRSILGPKLFIIYINALCNVSNISKSTLFADDTTIFYSDNDINTLGKVGSVELEELHTWFNVYANSNLQFHKNKYT